MTTQSGMHKSKDIHKVEARSQQLNYNKKFKYKLGESKGRFDGQDILLLVHYKSTITVWTHGCILVL